MQELAVLQEELDILATKKEDYEAVSLLKFHLKRKRDNEGVGISVRPVVNMPTSWLK